MSRTLKLLSVCTVLAMGLAPVGRGALAQRTVKPVLHGKHWVAITGKPLAATAGAMIFARGGNAVDAACAMLAATSHDVGHAGLGRRDPGADLQPAHRRGDRHQRPGRRAHRRDGRVLPRAGRCATRPSTARWRR